MESARFIGRSKGLAVLACYASVGRTVYFA
jgi:hypothetical protein